ncbi:hypothetical protein PESP_b0144 [Pseudoalteromonas espejiana DSM 9414]|nr:hypothetical protein PESP_b0144 [Pseudoalteromonas espejiana DSM 9414]
MPTSAWFLIVVIFIKPSTYFYNVCVLCECMVFKRGYVVWALTAQNLVYQN